MSGADEFDVCDILESVGRVLGFGDFTRPPTPCARCLNSLAAEVFQVSLNLG